MVELGIEQDAVAAGEFGGVEGAVGAAQGGLEGVVGLEDG
jgi:hypothetical protein